MIVYTDISLYIYIYIHTCIYIYIYMLEVAVRSLVKPCPPIEQEPPTPTPV